MGHNTHLTARLVMVSCLLFGACAPTARAYRHHLRAATRYADVFNMNSLRAELMWHATLLTPALRAERVRYEAELRGLAPEQIDRSLPFQWSLPGTTFLVSLYAPKEVHQLALTDGGYWHLELLLPSGETVEPVAIEESPISPLERKLFPFLNQWTKVYFVRFQPTVAEGTIRLSIKGLHARSELRWLLP